MSCSVLQRVGVLQCVAAWCSVLQRAAVCCSVLQCAAVCCSVLQCFRVLQCVAECCTVLHVSNESIRRRADKKSSLGELIRRRVE